MLSHEYWQMMTSAISQTSDCNLLKRLTNPNLEEHISGLQCLSALGSSRPELAFGRQAKKIENPANECP